MTTSADPWPSSRVGRYFSWTLTVFIFSFLILPSAKSVNNVFYVLLLLPGIIFCVLDRARIAASLTGSGIVFTLALAFVLWIGVTSATSGTTQSLKHFFYVGMFLLIASRLVLAEFFSDPRFVRSLFWSLVIYVTGAGIYYWLTERYNVGQQVLWLPSRMDGPIFTCMWVASCFSLVLPVWLRGQHWRELVLGTVTALFCMSYILQSRSGLVGFIFAVLVIGGWHLRSSKKQLVVGIVSLIGFVILVTGLAQNVPEVARLFSRGDALRFEIWGNLWREWTNCGWLMGCGLTYQSPATLSSGGPIFHPHNIYIAWALYYGLPALVLFLILMLATLRRAWQAKNRWGLYLATSLVSLNFDGSVLIDNPDERWLLVWLPVALIWHHHAIPAEKKHA